MGRKDVQGRIWDIDQDSGAYEMGRHIYTNTSFPVTMFPEDPGNKAVLSLDTCGDGVIGVQNTHRGDMRVSSGAGNAGDDTGALAFVVDAILNHGVRNIGLFGYSHGGGCLQVLIDGLAARGQQIQALGDLLRATHLPEFVGQPLRPDVSIFWTAAVDAVDIYFQNKGGGELEATGNPFPESHVPIETFLGGQLGNIGSESHYSIFQSPLKPFLLRDYVPVHGDYLDVDEWTNYDRLTADLWQVSADEPGGFWAAKGYLDHTNSKGHGIAEDIDVQNQLYASLDNARNRVGL